jgi:hypothetical protein
MLPLAYETRLALGDITETEYRYGQYILKAVWYRDADAADVSVRDISEIRFPLKWSKRMTKAQAHGAIQIFEAIGYFDMI